LGFGVSQNLQQNLQFCLPQSAWGRKMRSPWSALGKRRAILGEPIRTMMRKKAMRIASQIHPSLTESWNGIHLPTSLERLPGSVREDRRPRKAQPSFSMFSLSSLIFTTKPSLPHRPTLIFFLL
jgi:hypothetical protein